MGRDYGGSDRRFQSNGLSWFIIPMDLALPIAALDLDEAAAQARFDALQARLVPLWESISSLEDRAAQTIVVVPSLTVEFDLVGSEMQAYEERFLFLLLLLRQPRARLVYVTSQAIDPAIVDYYLGLLPGLIMSHARERLHLVTPHDASGVPLTLKLLQRPGLIERIRRLIPDVHNAHLVPFNTTGHERDLALKLGIPMYGADPRLLVHGEKSGCRKLFRRAGIRFPEGFEDLTSVAEVTEAIHELKKKRPAVQRVMVKTDEGVSGDGNAIVDVSGLDSSSPRSAFEERVRALTLESRSLDFDGYFARMKKGGIVEERISGDAVESPSAQLRVTPLGELQLLSTHDQLLGGPTGQTFLGSTFPARDAYGSEVARQSLKVGELLAAEGVLGRFAIDYLAVLQEGRWVPYAIEVNLRKGGTTHPFLTLQYLTDGTYDWANNEFRTGFGRVKHYFASDHLEAARYRALDHEAVFDLAVRQGLHFDHTTHRGVVFHMMRALGDRGRIGLTAIGDSAEEAQAMYQRTVDAFDRASASVLAARPLPAD